MQAVGHSIDKVTAGGVTNVHYYIQTRINLTPYYEIHSPFVLMDATVPKVIICLNPFKKTGKCVDNGA